MSLNCRYASSQPIGQAVRRARCTQEWTFIQWMECALPLVTVERVEIVPRGPSCVWALPPKHVIGLLGHPGGMEASHWSNRTYGTIAKPFCPGRGPARACRGEQAFH